MEIVVNKYPNDNEICLDSTRCIYYQGADCVSDSEDFQEITLETRNGGGGDFINLKTNEYGWSFSDIDDLIKIIEDFKVRCSYESSNNS